MPTAREVKKRINSVKNIAQITRAMEATSASRVRRAQARVMASRAFAQKAWEILLNVQSAGGKGGPPLHPLLAERETVNKIMIVIITSDRGLAGAFNTNIIRVAQRFAQRLGKPVQYVTVGRKARDAMIRGRENVVADFSDLPAETTISNIAPINRLAIDAFLSGEVDKVFLAYTDFINMLTQRPAVLGWLPLIPYETDDQVVREFIKDVPKVSNTVADYEYEPGPEAILEEIVPRFTELQLFQALLESQASEHAARMVAMRNASDNANQLTADYTLIYNKARQAAITNEILDIVGGAEALQSSIDSLADDIVRASYYETVVNTPKPRSSGSDDLTRLEGIGKKMAGALKSAGIDTFAKLARSTEAELRAAIEAAGMNFSPALPSWPKQAEFAAQGNWDGLKAFQNQLIAGREA